MVGSNYGSVGRGKDLGDILLTMELGGANQGSGGLGKPLKYMPLVEHGRTNSGQLRTENQIPFYNHQQPSNQQRLYN